MSRQTYFQPHHLAFIRSLILAADEALFPLCFGVTLRQHARTRAERAPNAGPHLRAAPERPEADLTPPFGQHRKGFENPNPEPRQDKWQVIQSFDRQRVRGYTGSVSPIKLRLQEMGNNAHSRKGLRLPRPDLSMPAIELTSARKTTGQHGPKEL